MDRGKLGRYLTEVALIGFTILTVYYGRAYERATNRITELEGNITSRMQTENEMKNRINGLVQDLSDVKSELVEREKYILDLEAELQAHEEVSLLYMGEFHCNAYCTEKYAHICGGGNGITASGAPVTAGVSVALSGADLPNMPYGTVIYIEGVGVRIVQDTGGMKSGVLDVAVPTHSDALSWSGQGKHRVWVVNMKEGGQE